ncbi:hypothetical protein CK203_102206 [Vitis vinifera]|uniref:Reverse transcriptase/retrotransposon-derived protein RNase H-like domain-containing protein n=1 Tax=Vitis vinifera TaxID=29760 RepID=A0A438DFF6_VITVI|nr:hypothetical protein CK203_102206 [Vitis vinifera]
MEEEAKPIRQPQRRLNPHMQEWCELRFEATSSRYYLPHIDSPWVSPTQVVPKKSGITVVKMKREKKLLHASLQCWRESLAILSIVSWTATPGIFKLKSMLKTGEDHFHMSIWNICLQKNAFWFMQCTCNIPTIMLSQLGSGLNRCIEKLGAQLGEMPFYGTSRNCPWPHHLRKSIEVDKAKVELIVKLPSPTTIKGVRQFLGHAGFYRRFIKDFSKLSKLFVNYWLRMLNLAPNWQLPFEVMCDASDFAIGAVLGQREDGKPYVIYYASKTLNEAQRTTQPQRKNSLKYLLTKQDAKARLIRWILLLQEFNLQIRDKKGVENVVADHLSSPSEWKTQDMKHFFAKIHAYYWEEHFLFKYCADQIIRKCVPEEEQQGILNHCHDSA